MKFLGSYPAAGESATAIRREATAEWERADAWLADLQRQIRDSR